MGGHSITATYEGDATYASSTSAPFSYAVTAKTVTITGMTAADKVYDGTTAAVLTGGTVSGTLNGDTVTAVAGTGTSPAPMREPGRSPPPVTRWWRQRGKLSAIGPTDRACATITARPLQLAGSPDL